MMRYQVILNESDMWGGAYLRYRSVVGCHSVEAARGIAKRIGAFCVFDALSESICRG